MYLKSIKVQGFKSFADKVELEINSGITGIVGPNGSGKSNIVDAVRWVLGEQSVKSLRGSSSMADVIFNGSNTREASKRAMVALTFDNSDNYLNSEFKEIEIKRTVYATGENTYFLNNTQVRLKDILNLFINSGTSINDFNIISQGNISNIINLRPHERRLIFESAAGVLKYKKRKEESLHKLESTDENLTRVKLVINEILTTIEPLKKESEEAKKYLELKDELNEIDISLIANDITSLNSRCAALEEEIKLLQDKIDGNANDKSAAEIEKLKLKNIKIDDEITKKREELLHLTDILASKTGEKQITLERQKYGVDKSTIDKNLVKLKEEELHLREEIGILEENILDIENKIDGLEKRSKNVKDQLDEINAKKDCIDNKIYDKNKQIYINKNKIDILENNILSYDKSPASVKNILNNPRLHGIHNIISKVLTIKDRYAIAIDVALGASSNYIIVDTDESAKEAISFLKSHKLGRATFLPLNIIKGRSIDEKTLNDIKNIKGYIGIASKLVQFNPIYKNIIENQIGNVIVVDNNDTLNIIGKLINYKYRVVSLDGEILHAGGSITGGVSKQNNLLLEKIELNKLKDETNSLSIVLESLNHEIDVYNKEIIGLEKDDGEISHDLIKSKNELEIMQNNLEEKNISLTSKTSELEGMNDIANGNTDKKIVSLLEEISKCNKDKEKAKNDIKNLVDERDNILVLITDEEHKIKEQNTKYQENINKLKEKEIEKGKIEVKLDNLLMELNEDYSLTYENALEKYSIDIDISVARDKVSGLKREIQKYENVNLGSISEYERLNERYEFLNTQKNELELASDELLDIIKDMDKIMIEKFKEAFKNISKEFSNIFKLMFKGGEGKLVLDNPSDLLNTGVEIIAIPPGKKINSPLSLSEGEKSLTAIVLLLSILRVKPTPFVILDEADSALDEVNVDMFGKYISKEKEKSQFIVITHKKKMMEYADVLYGITMQESGVSKLVSTKLKSN